MAGHLNIGAGAQIAAQSGVMRDVPAGRSAGGHAGAADARLSSRQVALAQRGERRRSDERARRRETARTSAGANAQLRGDDMLDQTTGEHSKRWTSCSS